MQEGNQATNRDHLKDFDSNWQTDRTKKSVGDTSRVVNKMIEEFKEEEVKN